MGRSTPFQKRADQIRAQQAQARVIRQQVRAAAPVIPMGGQFGDVEFLDDDVSGVTLWTHTFESAGTIQHPTFRCRSIDGEVHVAALVDGTEMFERTVNNGDTRLGDKPIYRVSAGQEVTLVARAAGSALIEQAGLFLFFQEG